MSDDVSQAAMIGAGVTRSLGSIPQPKRKRRRDEKTTENSTQQTKEDKPSTSKEKPSTSEKKEKPARDPKAPRPPKAPKAPKGPKEDKNPEPIFVRSERVDSPAPAPTAIEFDKFELPTHGPGSEYHPMRSRQFDDFA